MDTTAAVTQAHDLCPPNTVLIFLTIGAVWTGYQLHWCTYAKESLKEFKRELRSNA